MDQSQLMYGMVEGGERGNLEQELHSSVFTECSITLASQVLELI